MCTFSYYVVFNKVTNGQTDVWKQENNENLFIVEKSSVIVCFTILNSGILNFNAIFGAILDGLT